MGWLAVIQSLFDSLLVEWIYHSTTTTRRTSEPLPVVWIHHSTTTTRRTNEPFRVEWIHHSTTTTRRTSEPLPIKWIYHSTTTTRRTSEPLPVERIRYSTINCIECGNITKRHNNHSTVCKELKILSTWKIGVQVTLTGNTMRATLCGTSDVRSEADVSKGNHPPVKCGRNK